LVVLREIGDRRGEGVLLGNLGIAYYALGDARRAIEFYEQALVIDRDAKHGDRRGEGADLGNLDLAYYALGDARKAIEFHEQALVIDRDAKHGDRRGEGADLGNLDLAYYALGDARKAIEFHEQALVIDRDAKHGDRRGEGADLGNLGSAYYSLGDARQAAFVPGILPRNLPPANGHQERRASPVKDAVANHQGGDPEGRFICQLPADEVIELFAQGKNEGQRDRQADKAENPDVGDELGLAKKEQDAQNGQKHQPDGVFEEHGDDERSDSYRQPDSIVPPVQLCDSPKRDGDPGQRRYIVHTQTRQGHERGADRQQGRGPETRSRANKFFAACTVATRAIVARARATSRVPISPATW